MIEEYEKKRRKQVSGMRAILDYVMGLIFIAAGVFAFFRDNWKMEINLTYPPDWKDKVLGVLFVVYGIWRLYRGYKKNYFV
jgi:threonine/homoserine/homoserine lactone efflux protein